MGKKKLADLNKKEKLQILEDVESRRQSRKKLADLTKKEKLQILEDVESRRQSRKKFLQKYGCSYKDLRQLITEVKKMKSESSNSPRKRLKLYGKIEADLLEWYNKRRLQARPITAFMVREKAIKIAEKQGNEKFAATYGWMRRWLKGEGITVEKQYWFREGDLDTSEDEENYDTSNSQSDDKSKAKSVDKRRVQSDEESECATDFNIAKYAQANLSVDLKSDDESIIENPDCAHANNNNISDKYSQENIFNAATTTLYYNMPLTMNLTNEDCGSEEAIATKESLKLLFICNATGDYKKVYVIGPSMESLDPPLKYYTSEESSLTREICFDIVKKINAEMQAQKRKIILFSKTVSILTATQLKQLKNVCVQCPPTDKSQPLNVGIIEHFKSHYDLSIMKVTAEVGIPTAEFVKSINILQAMFMIKHSFDKVQPDIIAYCFEKSNFAKFTSIDNHSYSNAEVWCNETICEKGALDSTQKESSDQGRLTPTKSQAIRCIYQLRAYFMKQEKHTFFTELDKMEDVLLDKS